MTQRVCVVVPTYNEAENIKALIQNLETVATTLQNYTMDILVADDKSPDGTADIVKNMQTKYNNIHIVSGDKKGMGQAYIRAFSKVIDSYHIIITMDADFSHPPEMIPQFLEKIKKCDIVIGSRYILGGSTPDWPVHRQLISKSANALARIVAGLSSVHDCTSNYRAIKTVILKKISFNRVSNKGYAFVTSTLWEYKNQNARICEIPLVFHDRKKGKTKLRLKDMIKFFFNCFRLRIRW
ncbi:MAG: polyprenol monophosphomannose synthase [Candidatus Methanofastidiosia archaeon]|jgi:dolichol-phosphate mannosyltransferase